MKNTSFKSPTGNKIVFDKTGSIEGKYSIINYQLTAKGIYNNVIVGLWDGTQTVKLKIDDTVRLQFGSNSNNSTTKYESQCQQCPLGHIKKALPALCCGICDACIGQNYTSHTNSTWCDKCPDNKWGNYPLNGSAKCQPIKETYLEPTDAWAIILLITASIGLTTVVIVSITLGVFWKKPAIKSSGREQMILLLCGITLCFIVTVFFVLRPSTIVCLFQRISIWLCFSLILSAIFTKLVRIARIFLRSKGSGRPKFIGPVYQIMFTLLLVGVQGILVMISLIIVYPETETTIQLNSKNTNDFPLLLLRCQQPHIVLIILNMLYNTVLLIACNALALLTIKFPENFNEVRYVAFSTFSLGLIWIAFVLTYFTTNNENQIAVISFALQLSALAVLVCMFGPRMFIVIFLREKTEPITLSAGNFLDTVTNRGNKRKESLAPEHEHRNMEQIQLEKLRKMSLGLSFAGEN